MSRGAGFPSRAFPGPSAAASLDTALPTVPAIPEAAGAEAGASGGAEKDGQDGKKKKNRCASCKKKLGLTGFTCRCGELFCSIHRYSDKHQCGFDYKVTPAFPRPIPQIMRHIVLLARILCSGAFLFQVFLFSHQNISFPPRLSRPAGAGCRGDPEE